MPSGLKWFTLKTCRIELGDASVAENGPFPFEAIEEVFDFSTSSEFSPPSNDEKAYAYVRTQFVTGEKGLVHVLKFQS